MAEIIRIPDGNAFLLRVTGQIRTGDYTEDADFSVVTHMGVNFVRRGRIAQTFGLDSLGRIVIENSGNLAQGVYGVELYGYYHGEPWRNYQKNVFQIVNENANSDPGSDNENVLTYDVTFDVTFGGDGISAAFVEATVATHNGDQESHPDLREEIEEKVSDVKVGDTSVVEGGVAVIDLSGKQDVIDDLSTIRSGAAAGGTAYQKPGTGIPASDLSAEVQDMIENGGKTKSVSVNGGTPVTPDANGQVDLTIEQANVTIGNVTTGEEGTNAEVTNSGTPTAPVLNFKIPRGNTGGVGPKGDPGDSVIVGEGDLPLAHVTGQSTEKAMSQKGVTDELDIRPYTDGNNTADLDIADENGFVIARFSDGHFKTKYFDSRKNTPTIDVDIPEDLDIVDEEGNVLARFSNGHVKTKRFDSSTLAKRPYQRVTRFSYAVDCNSTINKDFATPTALSQYTQKALYYDNAVLYLPNQYTADGTPTKLIIYCKHGASQINNGGDPIMDSIDSNVFRYLLSLGYAVLGADGVPDAFASERGICERVVGNYIAVQSTLEAYNYVIRHYNIDENGSFIYGCSQGGHYAQNVIDLSGIPFLATAEVSPVCSMRYHQWDLAASGKVGGVTWSKLGRLNIARLFDFPAVSTNAQLLALEYDQENVQGYDPWTRNVIDPFTGFVQSGDLWGLPSGTQLADITMKKMLKCPLKIWAAANDNVVGIDVTKVFIKAAKNAGCVADMHLYEDGAHSIQNSQQAIGTFLENGETCDLYPLAYEIGLWYSQFGGYENINI